MTSDSSTENYLYHVVEFISAGRKPQIRKVDVVATKWIFFDKIKKKCITRYPPPPYTSVTHAELNLALEELTEAPNNWKNYSIKIRGKARTLDEALAKLDILREKESSLTMTSDENLSDVERKAVEQIRQNKLKYSAVKFKQSLENENSRPLTQSSEVVPSLSTPLTEITNSSTQAMERRNSGLSRQTSMKFNSKQLQNTVVSPRNENFITNVNSSQQSSTSSITFDPAEKQTLNCSSNDAIPSKLNNSNHNVEKVNFQHVLLGYVCNMMADLKTLKNDVKDVQLNIQNIQSILTNANATAPKQYIGTVQQICQKFNYKIPFETVEEFQIFDINLKQNNALYEAVANALQTGLDTSYVISRSIVNMLKMFLSKQVASKYTAVKNVKGKWIMKTTTFFTCIEVLIKERRSISKLDTSDKDMVSALSAVLSNSCTWYVTKTKSKSNREVYTEISTETTTKDYTDDTTEDYTEDSTEDTTKDIMTSEPLETIFVDPSTLQISQENMRIIASMPIEPPKKRMRLQKNVNENYEHLFPTTVSSYENNTSDSEEFDENYLQQFDC